MSLFLNEVANENDYVAAFDLDGTLLKKNSSIEFLKFLLSKKKITFSNFLYLSGCYLHHKFFHTSYLSLQSKVFGHFFKGLPLEYFTDYIPEFVEKHISHLIYPPALAFLNQLKEIGIEVMILSNSPVFLVQEIASFLGVKKAYGTSYTLDGEQKLLAIDTIMDGEKKADIVRDLPHCKKIFTISDSMHDFPFLIAAHFPICVNPDRKLRKIALRKKWPIL